ncbi:hypothetical protein E2C01_023258 [Portunus trituberculatus]|uniref:Uncharacterized protein n=1 Tax=Portunus trituberculatus TaxID=210409 RepID=A0A5B7EB42_PORTR|nr:hypothetical protein [Portunus trituberculatus]
MNTISASLTRRRGGGLQVCKLIRIPDDLATLEGQVWGRLNAEVLVGMQASGPRIKWHSQITCNNAKVHLPPPPDFHMISTWSSSSTLSILNHTRFPSRLLQYLNLALKSVRQVTDRPK